MLILLKCLLDLPLGKVNKMTCDTRKKHFETAMALTIHDVKNSLAIFLDRLERVQAEDENAGKKYASFNYEVQRINNNLVRLLALYKVDADTFVLRDDYHHIDDFLVEIAAGYAAVLNEKCIELILECPEDLCYRFDKALIYGVLDNALNNAVRYTHSKIMLKASGCDDYLVLSVQDNGDGYPDNMLLQESSGSCETEIDMAGGTTGLGNYFSQIVAGLHKADKKKGYTSLTNGSELGGSCFSIYLPGKNSSFPDF